MKLDKFESYIKDNREQLDTHVPPESVWRRIAGDLPQAKTNTRIIYWQAAAVLFFILSCGLLVNSYITNSNNQELTGNDNEFNKTEEYYFSVIEDKEVLLTANLKNFPVLAKDFKKDLTDLTKNYQKLKVEFAKNKSEEVLNALIKNLQLQQDLLNNQLKIIHQITEENENVSI